MLENVLDRLFGFNRPRLSLHLEPLPVKELPRPGLLSFPLATGDGRPCVPLVAEGQEVKAGEFLADDSTRRVIASPVSGKVAGVGLAPGLRGEPAGQAVFLEPFENTSPVAFDPMDPESGVPANLWDRIEEAGIITDCQTPRPLNEVIGPLSRTNIETLVILAVDREPSVASLLQTYRDNKDDAFAAARMLARISGAKTVMMALPAHLAQREPQKGAVGILSVPPVYPESLEPLIALRVRGPARVVSVETAMAALRAVRQGEVQEKKTVTVVGPDGRPRMNLKVTIGTRLVDVMKQARLAPRDRDKVVAGGPMRGFAQYTLETSVDQGVDAIMLVPAESQVEWSDDPCISCGECIRMCPVNLQPGLIARYAEYGLFDRCEDLAVENCIECGLCAYVCTSRRPLIQFLRLAKKEIEKKRAAQAGPGPAQESGEEEASPGKDSAQAG